MNTGTKWYLDEIGRIPLLTPAEELHLGALVREWLDHPGECPPATRRRGLKARDRFVAANLRLAVSFVNGRCQHLLKVAEQDDLIQAANLGLVRAVERFDPTRGYKFSTLAYWWIRQAVNRYVDNSVRLVKLPSHHGQYIRKLATLGEQYIQAHGHEPTLEQLAEMANMPLKRVRMLAIEAQSIRSLNERIEEGAELGEIVAAAELPEFEDSLERQEVLAHLETLDSTSRNVVIALYGLEGNPMTATEIAKKLELPDHYAVRKLAGAALRPLQRKHKLQQDLAKISDFLDKQAADHDGQLALNLQ
jgi:RNA polymerase sigma factor (sigma-70 family)